MYGDLIPVNLQDELIAIRDSNTRQSWRIADIVDEVISFCRTNNREAEMQEVYAAVGLFAGRASRTVREYHAIGRFFPPEIREQFECLAFDHFRHAAQLGDRAIEALQWAMEQTDELNRPATVDAMSARYMPPEPGAPEPPPGNEEGPAGIYDQIFRNASTQDQAADRWLGFEMDADLRAAIGAYQRAARGVINALPVRH